MNRHIKQIMEGLFDDELFDTDINNDINLDSEFNEQFIKLLEDILCKESRFNKPTPDPKDGLPLVLRDNDENIERYYVDPQTNYTLSKLGPRKRKGYNLCYFYKYIIEFNDNGHIILYVGNRSGQNKGIVSNELYEFIEKSFYKIDTIIYRKYGNAIIPLDYFDKFMIIAPYTDNGKSKISDKFINNFPDEIVPKENIDFKNENNPNSLGMSSIYRKSCSSDAMFMKLIEKLVNNGFNVTDENFYIYNQETLEQRKNELLSGELDKQIEEEKDDQLQFVKNTLGEDHFNKLQKIIDYQKETNVMKKQLHEYITLRDINTLRTCKICCKDTIYNLRKNNDLLVPAFDGKEEFDDALTYYQQLLLWKMWLILKDEKLYGWKLNYDFSDFTEGYTAGGYYGYGSSYFTMPDINTLPIKISESKDLYTLYYVIGKALKWSKDLYNFVYGKAVSINEKYEDWSPKGIMEDFLSAKDMETFNSNSTSYIKDFNFTYLTDQLKTIIDKVYKKYKLHKQ